MSRSIRAAGLVHTPLIAAIREGLATGQLAPGDRLPSEAELAREYNISITSVRRGIDTLVSDGIVKRIQGSGTYVQTARPKASAAATTVAVAMNLMLKTYHPFFSEMRRGILTGIADAGWNVWEYPFVSKHDQNRDLELVAIEDGVVDGILARNDIAGAIIGASTIEELAPRLHTHIPIVAPDATPACPYASYDWDMELERLIRYQLRRGARNIRIMRAVRPEVMARAQAAEGVTARIVPIAFKFSHLLSELAARAFDATLAAFAEDPAIDGVIIGDDFAAQGVVDALQKLERSWPETVQVAALVNKESVIRTPRPFTTLIADGYANGRAIAVLMDEHIRRPDEAPRACTLSCTLHEV